MCSKIDLMDMDSDEYNEFNYNYDIPSLDDICESEVNELDELFISYYDNIIKEHS